MATYFNKTLYLRNLRRFWPIFASITLFAFFAFIVPTFGYRAIMRTSDVFLSDMLDHLTVYSVTFIPLFSIITAIAMFGYLHKPRAAGFVSSLPVSRLCLYITNWVSGITILLAPMVLVSAICGVFYIGLPFPLSDIFIWVGVVIALHCFYYSMAVLTTFLTGKPVMQAFLFGFINFVTLALYGFGFLAADQFLFGFMGNALNDFPTSVALLTPPVAFTFMISEICSDAGLTSLIAKLGWVIYPIVTVLMIFFGYLLYRYRRIESAGDIITHKPVRSVFKYLIGLLMGAVLGTTLTAIIGTGVDLSVPGILICLTISVIIFGALGCLFTEMLIRKSFRVWKTAKFSMLFFAAGVIAIALFIRFDGAGYERRTPNADDVVAVSFSTTYPRADNILYISDWESDGRYLRNSPGWSLWGRYCCEKCDDERNRNVWTQEIIDEIKQRTYDYYESPEAIAAAIELQKAIIDNKRDLESNDVHAFSDKFYLTYVMKNGKIVTREYVIPYDESVPQDVAEKMIALYNQPEAVNKRNRFTTLPDTAILLANAAMYTDFESIQSLLVSRSGDMIVPASVTISEDRLYAMMDAMRRDAAAGSLGHVDTSRHHRLYYSQSYTLTENPTTVVINIIYDHTVVGVPPAFDNSSRVCPDTDEHIEGLLQTVVINVNNVHTMQVLKDLGLFE